jgi:ABC-type lipoprotein release transport system permease subunit
MIWKLAARNLVRNLRRTLITVAAIGLGLGLMIWTVNLQAWQHNDITSRSIRALAGDAVVQAEGYRKDPDAAKVVVGSGAVATAISELFPDAIVTRRLQISGVLMSANNTVGVGLQGVLPGPEAEVNDLDERIVEGTWVDDDPRGIVLGKTLAEKLAIKLGDKVVFMGQADGEMGSTLFRVKGIFRTGGVSVDGFVALANLEAVQGLYTAEDPASQVALHLEDHELAAAATEAVRGVAAAEGREVLDWRAALPQIVSFIEMDRRSNDLIWMVVGVMVAVGVLNTVLMSVMERVREFGVMMSVGMQPQSLARMVMAEGVLLGLIGAAVGLTIGSFTTWLTATYGLDLSASFGESLETGGVAMPTVFYSEFNGPRVAIYLVAAVVFTGLAALWPAWRVSRMQPVDAMRHQ